MSPKCNGMVLSLYTHRRQTKTSRNINQHFLFVFFFHLKNQNANIAIIRFFNKPEHHLSLSKGVEGKQVDSL